MFRSNNNNHLRQTVAYTHHLLPYSFERIQMLNGQPDILFHWHPECECIYVTEGSARFHIDDTIFISQAGDIIFIRPNALHSIHPIPSQNHIFKQINFHLDLIGLSTNDYSGIRYLQPLQNGTMSFIQRLQPHHHYYELIQQTLFNLFDCIECKKPFHSLLLKAQLNQLLYQLYVHGYINTRQHNGDAYRKEDKIRLVIDYLNHHYHEPVTIELLASLCGYSASHFMTFFKQHVGQTVNTYLQHLRLKQACELLTQSNLTITAIAEQCGYTNLSNFNRQFKAHYKLTPKGYRKSKNANLID